MLEALPTKSTYIESTNILPAIFVACLARIPHSSRMYWMNVARGALQQIEMVTFYGWPAVWQGDIMRAPLRMGLVDPQGLCGQGQFRRGASSGGNTHL
jgi:hypothetical protein